MVHGRYGEFKVLVDGKVVSDAGPMGVLGIVPPDDQIVEAVRQAVAPV
jgi:hypothetical protein